MSCEMDSNTTRIGFIGAGVLGNGLSLALAQRGYNVAAATSRRLVSAESLAARIPGCRALESPQELADGVDLVFITTLDSVISSVAAAVKWRSGHAVVHCCGAVGRGILQPAAEQGASTGAFHPLQTFAGLADPADTVARLAGVTFAVSANDRLQEFLVEAARRLGGVPVQIGDADRPLYHASAVLSCGYLAALLQGAVRLWQAAGFSEEQALNALLPLSRATLENVARSGIASQRHRAGGSWRCQYGPKPLGSDYPERPGIDRRLPFTDRCIAAIGRPGRNWRGRGKSYPSITDSIRY